MLLTTLTILGLSLVGLGPVAFIVVRSLRAGNAMSRRIRAILSQGVPMKARLLTLGPSHVSAAYPGNCRLLQVTVQPLDANGRFSREAALTIDQPIPKVALGAFHPGTEIVIRRDPAEPSAAAVDLLAMGYRA